jgi:hypothetical protein
MRLLKLAALAFVFSALGGEYLYAQSGGYPSRPQFQTVAVGGTTSCTGLTTGQLCISTASGTNGIFTNNLSPASGATMKFGATSGVNVASTVAVAGSGWTVSSGCTTTPAQTIRFIQSGGITQVQIGSNSCTISGAPISVCISGSFPTGITAPTLNNGYAMTAPGTLPAGTAQSLTWIPNTGGFCVTTIAAAALSGTLGAGVIGWNGVIFTYNNAI